MTLYSPINSFVENLRKLFKNRVKDGRKAYLGDGTGRCEVPDRLGYYYYRFELGGSPSIARSGNASFPVYEGSEVYVAIGYNHEPEIVGAVYQRLDQSGVDTRTLNQMHQQSKWVYLWQITIGLCTAVATGTTNSLLVSVKKHLTYFNNTFSYFETGEEADKIDLAPYMPAVDQHCYAMVWVDLYGNVAEVTVSTAQSLFMPLDINDINEAVASRPPDSRAYKAFVLANNSSTLRQGITEVDPRQFLNVPQTWGFPNPVAYRERIHPDRQVVFAGSLVVTGSLEVLGSLVGVSSGDSGGGSGSTGAPADATYIVQTPSSGLSAEQAMSALATGLVKNTTATGVQSIAVADTDYSTPAGVAALIALLSAKKTVQLSTVLGSPLPANTYANGTSGVGATLTANANGALSVDGNAVAVGDRLLIAGEGSGLKNGIYVVTAAGSGGAPYILTRATDADTSDEIRGSFVFALDGSARIRHVFVNYNTSAITIGTDTILYFDALAAPTLNNLTTTAINADLVPATNGVIDIGSLSIAWRSLITLYGLYDLAATAPSALNTHLNVWAEFVGAHAALFSRGVTGDVPHQLTPMVAKLYDSQASGTSAGGTTATTWVTRPLNTESDADGIVTLSSNKFVPVAGVYEVRVYATVVGGSAAITLAEHRLFNVTTTTEVAKSQPIRAAVDSGGTAAIEVVITANGTDEYRIDTYATVTRATIGLGQTVTTGSNDHFTSVILKKIG